LQGNLEAIAISGKLKSSIFNKNKGSLMTWMKVLPANALSDGSREVVKIGKRNILLLKNQGELIAVDNICPHLKLPLKKGKITEDGAIVCPWHKSAFDLHTGEVKQWCPWPPVVGKALALIKKENSLPTFPVRVQEYSIWVDVED
jgi:nitrite reductase/ring-hydroxylating ferredoxin subunit